MKHKALRTLVVLNAIATLGAIFWATIWLVFGRLALVDTNFEAIRALSPEQGEGIAQMSSSILQSAVLPLLLTNCIWLSIPAVKWLIEDVSALSTDKVSGDT